MAIYTVDWFTPHISIWQSVLQPFRDKPVKFLEIGSFEGRSTVWLLENILTHADSTITCVDPYKEYEDLQKQHIDWEAVKNRFIENTKQWEQKVLLKQEESTNFMRYCTENTYDFIYLDGCHTARQTMIDAILAHIILKPDGILIFDDYLWAGLAIANNVPKGSIDAFMTSFSGDYDLKSLGYQVILQKK